MKSISQLTIRRGWGQNVESRSTGEVGTRSWVCVHVEATVFKIERVLAKINAIGEVVFTWMQWLAKQTCALLQNMGKKREIHSLHMCDAFSAILGMKRLRCLAAHPRPLSCRMSADVFLQAWVRSKPVRQDIKRLGPAQGEQAFRWERPPGQSPKDGFD